MRWQMLAVVLLAALAARPSAARQLQQQVDPALRMPPLKEFLPPMDDVSLPPLEDFTAKLGLPQWSELGLPPIEKLLESGGPDALRVSDVIGAVKHADAIMTKLVYGLLPPDLRAVAEKLEGKNSSVPQLLGFNMTDAISKFNATDFANKINTTLPAALSDLKIPGLAEGTKIEDVLAAMKMPAINVTDLANGLAQNASRIAAALPPMEELARSFSTAAAALSKAMPKRKAAAARSRVPSIGDFRTAVDSVVAAASIGGQRQRQRQG
ncbi:hypothetical protein Rsub_02505 [Raphidocelis subcapitata]|uniref:Uncharacterized protein n=1 Tax=Raphidocelis subcapitata TaxID=307507 RepID=A0A2V0NSU9_9CHLO|nr:hypothetical protein Rsub_02505 [Raphidocelis subcapitata]|eukprot:GBF90399.1 hypothetical protein Rsub_02505 [Raphidocelis subcapitata]